MEFRKTRGRWKIIPGSKFLQLSESGFCQWMTFYCMVTLAHIWKLFEGMVAFCMVLKKMKSIYQMYKRNKVAKHPKSQ